METEQKQQFRLERETELRCEVEWDASLKVKLISGTAEIFGSEIAVGQQVMFDGGEKFAVFTWHGAVMEVEGTPALPDAMYVADETPMVSYINVHAVLNARRVDFARSLLQQQQPQQGEKQQPTAQAPRVVLAGPTDCGKSTLARMLLCWAARQGWHPTYVDLDVAHGSVTMPGAIAATPIEAPLEAGAKWVDEAPLTLFYGHTNPSQNTDLYKSLISALSLDIEQRLASAEAAARASAAAVRAEAAAAGSSGEEGGGEGAPGVVSGVESAAGGVIVNTMGWVDGAGYQMLLHAIECFQADIVLVIGHERLYSWLLDAQKKAASASASASAAADTDTPAPIPPSSSADEVAAEEGAAVGQKGVGRAGVQVVKLARSGGAVQRAAKFRQRLRYNSIHAYFYGVNRDLSPHSSSASWHELNVVKVGGGPQAPRSALPIGAQPTTDPLRVGAVELSKELEHNVLAVSYAETEEEVATSSIAGFIIITQVDLLGGKVYFLAPSPGPLPGKYLLGGTLTWVE